MPNSNDYHAFKNTNGGTGGNGGGRGDAGGDAGGRFADPPGLAGI